MKLTKLSDIRRQELRRAAVTVMQREGAAATTLEKVATEAGASKGIVLHYFRDKQDLFEQAMREANADLRDRVVRRLRLAETPPQRLWAIVEENLGAEVFRPPHGHAWLSLCAEAPRAPRLARLQRVFHSRMHSNMMSALTPLLPRDEAEALALTLSALIDGLWVRLGLGDRSVTHEIALDLARRLVARHLPGVEVISRDF
ncbi:choline-binding transcriptional repressor BetI [Tabrizicola oligotrophica]|uniref:HTH-type transcriptional regulator BetI n=1 Tax=Tabrizicola oligotrophica TaxID=2710650 RepID=A0A6M0QWE9_9RHOB|nr:transcriptional regulator BetI [Tabrizicola oligotrophica]NEY91750.1 transcriptional regulator BetI [Tabrizicola oligotrophica]